MVKRTASRSDSQMIHCLPTLVTEAEVGLMNAEIELRLHKTFRGDGYCFDVACDEVPDEVIFRYGDEEVWLLNEPILLLIALCKISWAISIIIRRTCWLLPC